MAAGDADTEDLIGRASRGDAAAVEELFARYRDRVRQMIAVRIDPGLLGRFDASDVVQETLVEASRKLPEYLEGQPLPFYPWLRQIAWERLVDARRRHVQARKRAVGRQRQQHRLPDRSTTALADRLIASGTSPSGHFAREELRDRMQATLRALPPRDREVLVLRHLEQLSTREIASVMGITESAVKMRQLRALQRLRGLLNDGGPEPMR